MSDTAPENSFESMLGEATVAPLKHPEDMCQMCGSPNPVWTVPNELWNKHAESRGYGIICPTCFAWLVASDGTDILWDFKPRALSAEAERDEIKALLGKVKEYAVHKVGCRQEFPWTGPPLECTCGLSAIQAQIDGIVGEGKGSVP